MLWPLCALGAAAAAGPAGAAEKWVGLSFSGRAPAAALTVREASRLVLRADRDVHSLEVTLRSARPGGAGRWRARLVPLPRVEEPEPPRWEAAVRTKPVWARDADVSRSPAAQKRLPAIVPRAWFESWALLLEPRGEGAGPVTVQVRAAAMDAGARGRWLAASRAQFDPEAAPDRVRELVRHLTDAEVLHWAGMTSRRVFLAGWRKMKLEEIERAFGSEERRIRAVPHPLPDGRSLLLNGPAPVPRDGGRPGREPGTASAPREAPEPGGADLAAGLEAGAPLYAAEVESPDGEYTLRLRVAAGLRGVRLRLALAPGAAGNAELELTETGKPERVLLRGIAARAPAPIQAPGGRQHVPMSAYEMAVRLAPDGPDAEWTARVRSVPAGMGKPVPALSARLRIESEGAITRRERELMAWRSRVDPVAQPDEVRRMVATMAAAEVRYYTGFPNAAAFLKHYRRTTIADLPVVRGGPGFNEETQGLTSLGFPLPDGRYLHHDGRAPINLPLSPPPL